MGFSIVHFVSLQEVEIVPDEWIKKDQKMLQCWWPPYHNMDKVMASVEKSESPNPKKWKLHNIRILKNYETYELAKLDLKRTESNLDSESEVDNKKKRNRDESSDSDNEPQVSPQRKQILTPPSLKISQQRKKQVLSPVKKSLKEMSASGPKLALAEGSGTAILAGPIAFAVASGSGQKEISGTPRANRSVRPRILELTEKNPFEIEVLKSLATIETKLSVHTEVLSKICKRLFKTPGATEDVRAQFQLPLTTTQDFKELEDSLVDDNRRMVLVEHLSSIGGADYADCVARMMSHLMTNTIASNFCWEGIRGENGKTPFKNFKLKQVLFDAVRKNPHSSSPSNFDVKKKAASWLQHAPDRLKSRKPKSETSGVDASNGPTQP